MRGFCSLYSKNIFNSDEEVVFNVRVQLPAVLLHTVQKCLNVGATLYIFNVGKFYFSA